MMKNVLYSMAVLFMGCGTPPHTARLPEAAHVAAEKIVIEGETTPIYMGGFGSSMVYSPTDTSFYLLTDRGPNVDGLTSESKVFPLAAYAPTIGRFMLKGDSLILIEKIVLKDSNDIPFTGLPNTEGDGVTGEVAYNLKGEVITNKGRGIDTEGLAIAPDGTFWVSDEYAPFVMQFNRNGMLMREFSPSKVLPPYFQHRRPNRGMEGLTISADGKRLYGIMQSPLYWPDKSTKDVSVNNRIIEIDLEDGTTREYLYVMEDAGNVVSEISFINDSTMLVLERDGKFPQNGKGFKRVYRIGLYGATDVSGRQVEMFQKQELADNGIVPVGKSLFVDILKKIPAYSHDKPEGIAMMGDSVLCVVNDDDFGISVSGDGKYVSKVDAGGRQDKNKVYFIRVAENK